MKKLSFILATVLCIGLLGGCTGQNATKPSESKASTQGSEEAKKPVGCFTQLGVEEAALNEATKDTFFKQTPFSGLKYFDSLNSMVMALESGELAAMEANELSVPYLTAKNDKLTLYTLENVPIYEMYFSMLLREEDADLRDKISDCITEMEKDKTIESLKKDYIDAYANGKDPKAVQPQKLEGAKTVTFAVTGDVPPMDFFDESGTPAGFNTALIAEIGKRLKINVELISIDSGARAVSLSSKKSDVIFWIGNANYDDWKGGKSQDQPEHTIATKPYISGKIRYLVLKDSPLAKKN